MAMMASDSAIHRDAASDVRAVVSYRALGALWIVYGVLRLLMAVILATSSGTATVMFGALLVRVADPETLMTAFHITYVAFILFSALLGVVGIIAGVALASGSASARRLTLFAAILAVSQIPIGTTLGAYTLVVLLPWGSRSSSAN